MPIPLRERQNQTAEVKHCLRHMLGTALLTDFCPTKPRVLGKGMKEQSQQTCEGLMCGILVVLMRTQQNHRIDKPGNTIICQKPKQSVSCKGKTPATVMPRWVKWYLEGHNPVARLEEAALPSHWQHLAWSCFPTDWCRGDLEFGFCYHEVLHVSPPPKQTESPLRRDGTG